MEKTYIELDVIKALISRLEQEPLYQHEGEDWHVGVSTVGTEIYTLPTVTFDASNKQAEWKVTYKGFYGNNYSCSNCNTPASEGNSGYFDKLTTFCPNCGFTMQKERTI